MRASEFVTEAWSKKYKSSINCSHPKGFSQRAHCAGKKKHNESVEMEMVCEDCGMCQTHGNLNEIKKGQKDSNGYTQCWSGYHAAGTKKSATTGKTVRNCVPNESIAEAAGRPRVISQEKIDTIKQLFDQGDLLGTIAQKTELPPARVSGILQTYYKDRIKRLQGRKQDASKETIDTVKQLYNQGESLDSIAQQTGVTPQKVNNILLSYYKDRVRRLPHLPKHVISSAKALSDAGYTPAEIAAQLGMDTQQLQHILYRHHPDRENKMVYTAIPSDVKPTIIDMYKHGKDENTIHAELNLQSTPMAIRQFLYRLPNWAELRSEHISNNPTRTHKTGEYVKRSPEVKAKIIDMYRHGKDEPTINTELNLQSTTETIKQFLYRLPNWAELRSEHISNKPKR